MTGEAWVFAVAWLMTLAALAVVLLGAASKQADMDKAHLNLGMRLLRVGMDRDDLAAENARLRRARLTVVHPATRDRMDRIRGVIAANEAGRWDAEWEQFNGGDAS